MDCRCTHSIYRHYLLHLRARTPHHFHRLHQLKRIHWLTSTFVTRRSVFHLKVVALSLLSAAVGVGHAFRRVRMSVWIQTVTISQQLLSQVPIHLWWGGEDDEALLQELLPSISITFAFTMVAITKTFTTTFLVLWLLLLLLSFFRRHASQKIER